VDCVIAGGLRPRQLVALLRENRDRIGAEVIGAGGVRRLGYYLVLAGRNADGSPCFLELDLSPDFEHGDLPFYAGREVLQGRRRHRQFWVPAARLEFGCYLIKKIAKGRLDDEQGRRLAHLYRQDPAGCRQQVARFWGAGSTALLAAAADSGDWAPVRRSLGPLGRELRQRATLRHPWRALWGWLCHQGRRARKVCRPDAGLHVVFLGPDGAGKSSVVQAVRQNLGRAFARTACHRFPPSVLSRLLRRPEYPPEKAPHGSPPRSFLASVVRAVGYWFVYYVPGYYVTVRPALARDTLVLHDRHLVDALVDPKRYRYGGPAWLVRLIWRLVPKPDLVILLDAPAAVLQARKQEVPFEETARQQGAYRSLVTGMRNGHVVDASRPLEQVVGSVTDLLLDHLAARLARGLRREHNR
jgi:thymidylate kinase